MTRVAILTPTLTSADAVSNDVLAMQRLLTERGHEVRIFAEQVNVAHKQVDALAAVRSFLRDHRDTVIYHHSIGWDLGLEVLKTNLFRTIIKYHNVTPPEFFEGISDWHRCLCETGRLQLKEIVALQPDLYMAASAFNKGDLIAAGSDDKKTFVVPPFNHAEKLRSGEADLEIFDRYSNGSVNLLTVGGVRPNKGHAALIDAFATYLHYFNNKARLLIVGSEDRSFATYKSSLREMIKAWHVGRHVVFTGQVSDDSLKAYYLLADALLITSEHEGFCVPLVEAMAMKVPIVAYASTAIPETVQDAGLIWEQRDPFLLAQSIESLLTDETTKMALLSRGSRRYEERFSNSAIEEQFLETTALAGFEF